MSRPRRPGAGTGARLLAVAERWARAAGAARAVLDTRPEREAACRLHRRAGWVEVAPHHDDAAAGPWSAEDLRRAAAAGGAGAGGGTGG